ncbi:hypothetical protein COB52_05765 [Candidatus Kaiserbacteria bacterium]|nr:MAG: hypothetical protein COB52_05765 [Candidatus Kaiserbacteria bacterium]
MKKHRWMNDDSDELMLAILELKNLAEARAFLGDLLTEKEIRGASNRWKAARMLSFGAAYRKIERITGMSSATISRIQKIMEGGLGGYSLMMRKLK